MLSRFLLLLGVFAVAVFVAVAALLLGVRNEADGDVDQMLQEDIEEQLTQSAAQQAAIVQIELRSVNESIDYLRDVTVHAYVAQRPASAEEVARYQDLPSGAYSTVDPGDGGSSMFYSERTEIGADQRAKASYLAAIDSALQGIVNSSVLAAQAYLNTYDGMTRIYPPFDIAAAFTGGSPAQDFVFYADADLERNPSRGSTWTEPYVDPAGQGWIVSAIAPIYLPAAPDFLEGVVGVDVPIAALVGQLLSNSQVDNGFSVLLDASGTIIAMPPAAEELLGVEELTDADYSAYIYENQFKPDDFNVNLRDDTVELAGALASGPSGVAPVTVGGEKVLAAWSTLEEPAWKIVTMLPDSTVQQLHEPGDRMSRAMLSALWAVLGAFVLLGVAVAVSGRRLSRAFTTPLEDIDDATARIAQGDFRPHLPPAPVAEIQRTGEQLLAMGLSLESAQQRMLDDADALREKEQRYRAIFDNVADPVISVDAAGQVIDANDAANTTFGRSLPGVDVGAELDTDAWRQPGRRTVELPVAGDERRTFDVAVSATGEGDDQLYTITLHDVTAEAEARLLTDAARATAERTARMKDEFLASMSHEIRTPLNGVIGVLSLLAERDLPDEARRELAVARRSADDLLVLVNDVLDFAKIEADQVSVVRSDVRLAEVLDGVRQLYSPLAAEQRTSLTVEIDPSLPDWVRLDPTRVRQVLVNLVSNALKFTERGDVRIIARPDTAGELGDTFQLRFEVIDTGVGVPPEVQSRLFSRFSQGDPLATRKHPGTGLGLAIVKRLAELMGGEVGMSSVPGKGSTFWFTVESGAGSVAADPALDVATEPNEGGVLRVLVAEDNEVNRYLIVAILHRLGHDVVAVVNGREAVEAAQQQHFDVILMDVQMPVANGIDATHAIRALPGAAARVPILAVTANVMPEQQELYRSAGFSGMVPKPLTLDSVATALAGVSPRAAGVAEDVAVADPADPARFDPALIEQYRAVIGPAGATEMVELFVRTLAERRAALGSAVESGDLAEAQRIGHALKGMAAAVGAVRLSAAGAALQHADGVGALDGLLAAFDAESAATLAGVHAAWDIDPT